MKIDNNNLIMRDVVFNLDKIAMIAVQQVTLLEEFGFEDNYWLEFKLANGDKYDIETSHTQEENVIVKRFKIVYRLLMDNGLKNFTNLGYMIVNLEHTKDIKLINKNKGVQIRFKDFHIDYPELGRWRAKRIIKHYNQNVSEYKNLQTIKQ